MKKLIFEIIKQGDGKRVKIMKYYLLDWDDNILYMPTKIYFLNQEGEEVGMSTHDFSHYRNLLDSQTGKSKEPFKYNDEILVGLSDSPFRDFRSDLSLFIQDVNAAEIGPAWGDLVEAINTGSYFSIITARGHNPTVLRDAVKIMIDKNFNGISKRDLINSLKKRKEKSDEEYTNDDDEIEKYLDMCVFYPVSYYHPSGASKPEEIKKSVILKFMKNIREMVDDLNLRMKDKGESDYVLKPVFGFSDDDLKNLEYAKEIEDINIYSTHGGKKVKIKSSNENIQEDIKRIKLLFNY